MRLLHEFIRNVNSMFGLDRRVTMNALADVVGGPDPQPSNPFMSSSPQSSAWVDATTHLKATMVDENDELENDLDDNVMEALDRLLQDG